MLDHEDIAAGPAPITLRDESGTLRAAYVERVATAIREHYAPKGPEDRCPTAAESVVVALADKLDTLVGFFASGIRPTGAKDPFALRRAGLGVIRLVFENRLRLPLRPAITAAAAGYGGRFAGFAPQELIAFLADRLKIHLRERGVRHDLIAAALAVERSLANRACVSGR